MSVATDLGGSTAFLYTGNSPIQTGVTANTIDVQHVAVLRGKVLLRSGAPLPAVRITILNHPEFGETLSRADGMFDMAVNGGGLLTVNYVKPGYLPAQRAADTPWEDFVELPDVVLIQSDPNVTTIDLTANIPIQVAQGSVISDTRGMRQQTLLFPQGTTASITLANGTTQVLTTLSIRSTEFTVGDSGPSAMPADLPPASGYTYAVDFSIDEATAVGATGTTFSPGVISYNENFLNFPAGLSIPVGAYDSKKAVWVPSDNGLVVKILSITNSKVDLDVDGTGVAATPAQLTGLGVTDAERTTLATLYAAGTSLWRVPVSHFSSWDSNWGIGVPDGSGPPPDPGPPPQPPDCKDNQGGGSTILCQQQIIGEAINLVGAPFGLHYSSDRVPGYQVANELVIPLSGPNAPAPLDRIDLEISIAGKFHRETHDTSPNQTTTFRWDGKDAYGRTLQGPQTATIRLGYHYPAVYVDTPAGAKASFGLFNSGLPISGGGGAGGGAPLAPEGFTFWQEYHRVVGTWDQRALGLGGWSLGVHHAYDPVQRIVYRGDGDTYQAIGVRTDVIKTVAGTGVAGNDGDGGPATQARFRAPSAVAAAPDGSFYVADQNSNVIRRVSKDGIISTVAGTGILGFSGDSGPAAQARLAGPAGLDIGQDGSLYITDQGNQRIRRVAPNGIITTVAGGGNPADHLGDGLPATQASLSTPYDVAVGADGSLYIADYQHFRVRRVGPDGIITTVAGNGTQGTSGDGGLATQAKLDQVVGVTVGPYGSLYLTDRSSGRVRRVGLDGIITTVAGGGNPIGNIGDGKLATTARLLSPYDVAFGSDGSFYIADGTNYRIRRVGTDGIITTVAGTGSAGFSGDGGLAAQARLALAWDIAITPDGDLLIADLNNDRIRRVSPSLPGVGAGNILIASQDGSEVYIFDPTGRHLRTVSALTGANLYTFGYDSGGRLTSIVDGDNNTTTIEHDGSGNPTAIVGPYGQRTTLSLDANGYLASVTNPSGEVNHMGYTADGLLNSFTDPRGNSSTMQYDAVGRLTHDQNAASGFWQLDRTGSDTNYTVTLTSALGRSKEFNVEELSTGDQHQVNTFPDGLKSEVVNGINGSRQITSTNNTRTLLVEGADPRWGMVAPLAASTTITTPNSLVFKNTLARTVALSDPTNPLSLTSMTESNSINGRTYTSSFDVASRTWTNTSPVGRQTIKVIDTQNRPTQIQVPNLDPTNLTYDARGRPSSITTGSGADTRTLTFAYDSTGYVQTITDPLSRLVTFARDAAGRITSETLPGTRVIGFGYDANGNTTSITPPGRPSHTFTYSAVNLLESYTAPTVTGGGTNQTLFAWNNDRQLDLVTRPDGKSIDYVYDLVKKRLTQVTIQRGSYSYAYNPTNGNISGITAPGGITLANTYDGALLTSQTLTGTVSGSVTHSYDNNFRVTSVGVNGSPIAYGYDIDSLLTSVGSMTLNRDAQNGLLRGTTLSNVGDTLDYNTFGEPSEYTATYNGTSIFAQSLTHDKLGRVSTKTETIAGVTSTYDYTYDAAGRLSEVKRDGVTTATYTYDSNGNRLTHTDSGGTANGTYDDQDRLTSYGANTYTYTANGELLTKTTVGQTTSYVYDELGNLVSVTLPDGTQLQYLIDGMNRRVGKKVNGALVQGFLYQSDLRIAAELDGSSNIVSRFIYATHVNVPDYMVKGGVTYRILTDHLGSPRLVVNVATGAIAQRMDYDEFGNVITDTNQGFQPFGVAGGLYDRGIKLARFGARDYDAEAGRWTTKDPIGLVSRGTELVRICPEQSDELVGSEGNGYYRYYRWDHQCCLGYCLGSLPELSPLSEHRGWLLRCREGYR